MGVFELHNGGGTPDEAEIARADRFTPKLYVAKGGEPWLCSYDAMFKANAIDVVMVTDPEEDDTMYTVSCFIRSKDHTDEYVVFSTASQKAAEIAYGKISDTLLGMPDEP